MRRFTALSPDGEVLGQLISGYKAAIGVEEFGSFFEKRGLGEINPNQWYHYQDFLDVLNDMVEASPGRMFDFVSIGLKIGEFGVYPPGVDQLPFVEILRLLNEATKLNVRGSDIGGVQVEPINDHHVKLILRQPLPDDVSYGIAFGLGRRFLPKGTHCTVHYDEKVPRLDNGGEKTIIHIKWE